MLQAQHARMGMHPHMAVGMNSAVSVLSFSQAWHGMSTLSVWGVRHFASSFARLSDAVFLHQA